MIGEKIYGLRGKLAGSKYKVRDVEVKKRGIIGFRKEGVEMTVLSVNLDSIRNCEADIWTIVQAEIGKYGSMEYEHDDKTMTLWLRYVPLEVETPAKVAETASTSTVPKPKPKPVYRTGGNTAA